MSYSNSDGTRRCDSRCYNARGHRCECICGGVNHGSGLQVAQDHVRRMGEGLLEAFQLREAARRLQTEQSAGQLFMFAEKGEGVET